ncbi:MAG: hypothetical protein ACYTEX_11965 [Planctomycetota bacterium]|jgi:hypothetical protein
MCKKIVSVVPLVLVLALVVSVSTSARGKVALTEAQMSSVYGGAKCKYYNNDGCEPLFCLLDCSDMQEWWDAGCVDDPNLPNNCQGAWETTCKEVQRRCNGGGTGCTDSTTGCTGTYDMWHCGYSPPPELECVVEHGGTYDCYGSRLWCVEN